MSSVCVCTKSKKQETTANGKRNRSLHATALYTPCFRMRGLHGTSIGYYLSLTKYAQSSAHPLALHTLHCHMHADQDADDKQHRAS